MFLIKKDILKKAAGPSSPTEILTKKLTRINGFMRDFEQVILPGWNGRLPIMALVQVGDGVVAASFHNREVNPDFYRIYAVIDGDTLQRVLDFKSADHAQDAVNKIMASVIKRKKPWSFKA